MGQKNLGLAKGLLRTEKIIRQKKQFKDKKKKKDFKNRWKIQVLFFKIVLHIHIKIEN